MKEYFQFLYYLPTIKVGNFAISGKGIVDQSLWDKGAIIHVWMYFFIIYELECKQR